MRELYYDVIVIGGGHAGCEAALAAARVGASTALFTLNYDQIAQLPCNPAIGGTSKGHLVREIDALGGAMGRCIDKTYLQSRMLNLSKGPAVHSLRAQADKSAYKAEMLRILTNEPNIYLCQAEVVDIVTTGGNAAMVKTAHGLQYRAKAVVLCLGTYLNARCLTGDSITLTGPNNQKRSEALKATLDRLNISTRRFKTGTPARVLADSVDFSQTEPQYGDEPPTPFSFDNTSESIARTQIPCHLTYTTEATAEIIRRNIGRSPMYTGVINAAGARYCPSIEEKITRFAGKPRHQVFLEPEGEKSPEIYVQGVSTSLPADVQIELYRSIKGLENARITRFGYAIEYDVVDSLQLNQSLQLKSIGGLFFAGQINGTSGYEEAAAQGLIAGANAALYALGKPQFTLTRAKAYIGVMIDDLVTKGVDEPYRMMTARAEYRLILRQDNADIRLYNAAYDNGLIDKERYLFIHQKELLINDALRVGAASSRPHVREDIAALVHIEEKYAGYIAKQMRQIAEFERIESRTIPADIDYAAITNMRIEAREKLATARPENVGRASRVTAVSPADISALLIYLRGRL